MVLSPKELLFGFKYDKEASICMIVVGGIVFFEWKNGRTDTILHLGSATFGCIKATTRQL